MHSPLHFFIALLFFVSALTEADIIRSQKPSDSNGDYAIAMAKLALSKINKPYELQLVDISDYTQARTFEEIEENKLDLTWTATDAELESKLEPIRIPLYKGLLGHRVFIIRREDQARFDAVNSLQDLKQFKFGQGTFWPDSKILAANGLTVVKAIKYENLFDMLDGSRFDAFPRGVQEPWQELVKRADLPLAVEQQLMLVYKMPFYLFTNKEHSQFARDMERGFQIAISDGSFDQLFLDSPVVKLVLEKANLGKRKVFYLDNPALPKATPTEDARLWLDLEQLPNLISKRHDTGL